MPFEVDSRNRDTAADTEMTIPTSEKKEREEKEMQSLYSHNAIIIYIMRIFQRLTHKKEE
jgi:hypothetical protein